MLFYFPGEFDTYTLSDLDFTLNEVITGRAAEQGDAAAQYNLAVMYADGGRN